MRAFLILGVALLVGSCGGGAASTPAESDTAFGCSPDNPSACAYEPEQSYALLTREQHTCEYTDEASLPRRIRIEVRVPDGAPQPMPVVVWSHGGSSGQTEPGGVGTDWSREFVSAGYMVVAIAHAPRDPDTELAPLTNELGFAPGTLWKYLNWDRPNDVRCVLDWVVAQASGPRAGIIDASRIVYAGHSAGGGSAMMVNGATREYAGVVRGLSDPRPVAFISCSPQGPGDDEFTSGSFANMARPHLFLTGAGDDQGHVAENRRLSFELAQPGGKYRGWIAEESARHATFNYKPDGCENHASGGDPARCAEHLTWLRSAVLAFLDAHLRDDPVAAAYLESDHLTHLSGGTFEWSRR